MKEKFLVNIGDACVSLAKSFRSIATKIENLGCTAVSKGMKNDPVKIEDFVVRHYEDMIRRGIR